MIKTANYFRFIVWIAISHSIDKIHLCGLTIIQFQSDPLKAVVAIIQKFNYSGQVLSLYQETIKNKEEIKAIRIKIRTNNNLFFQPIVELPLMMFGFKEKYGQPLFLLRHHLQPSLQLNNFFLPTFGFSLQQKQNEKTLEKLLLLIFNVWSTS